jgi:phage protein U
MRISKKALGERLQLQTEGMKSAYKKFKQGTYSKKEYDLEMQRLDNDFEKFLSGGTV